jgi:hypothetical protein
VRIRHIIHGHVKVEVNKGGGFWADRREEAEKAGAGGAKPGERGEAGREGRQKTEGSGEGKARREEVRGSGD